MRRQNSLWLQLLLLALMTSPGTTDVFSSSVKMSELALSENAILDAVQGHGIPSPTNGVGSSRPRDRRQSLQTRQLVDSRQSLKADVGENWSSHPNGAYLLIKAFVTHWNNVIKDRADLKNVITKHKAELPSQSDLDGSLAAILRLQRFYNIPTSQVYVGNYTGYTGPSLSPPDAYYLGRRAFEDGMIKQSIQWLEEARMRMVHAGKTYSAAEKSSVSSLLGRVYLWSGNAARARRLYEEGLRLDRSPGDLAELRKELKTMKNRVTVIARDNDSETIRALCSRQKNHTLEGLRPFHRCRWKRSLFTPYLRYKEEILSVKPFVSLFYDIIHDAEAEHLKRIARGKLRRGGMIGVEDNYQRTSDLGWVEDSESTTAARLSQRVKDITWLENDIRESEGPSSGEPFQVVNYGLGGHYSAHFDTFDTIPENEKLVFSGARIATFLLYLTDVEIGGHTAFVNAGISVAPLKGMALFWYNVNPNLEVDQKTLHAGCPVLKGHKWIANKWIWTYGNMYRRPCGSRPDSTQLEVEQITFSRRHNILP